MLKNYLKVALRQLARNGRYTAINLLALSVAVACCIVAYLNYSFSADYDAFHTHKDRIFRLYSVKAVGTATQAWGITPRPLGPVLERDVAAVTQSVRFDSEGATFQVGDKVFHETLHFADPAFFEVFTFPLQSGTSSVLDDPTQLVLTRTMAEKYFGDEDPLGQTVTVRFGETEHSFTVGAIAEDVPLNSSIRFEALTSYANLERLFDAEENDWGAWGPVTFVQVSGDVAATDLARHLVPYVPPQNAARPDWRIERYYAEPLPAMYLSSRDVRGYTLHQRVPVPAVIAPSVMAALLLLMACFNFMNTALAFAGRRLKEIGVRKVVGGLRRQLIAQFLGESLLLCVLAFGLALLLAEVFVPAWDSLWPYLDLELRYADNLPLLGFLGALLLFTALLAGLYPAFYISGFSPVKVLKGRQQLPGVTTLTRVLLTFQLTISVLVLIASVVFTQNAAYQHTLDMGYDRDQLVVVPLGQAERFTPYRDALRQHPDLLAAAGTRYHVGFSWNSRVARVDPMAQRDALENEVDLYLVGEDYLETAGLEIVAGRPFDARREADVTSAVLVNETFVKQFDWTDPLGQYVTMDSVRYEVVGVLRDFYNNVWNPITPSVFRLAEPAAYRYLVARVPAEDLTAMQAFMRETWQQVAPETPYGGLPQDEMMAEASLVNASIRTTFFYMALVAIVIAAAGLYALVSLNIARRTKEIGVRKVLGATVAHLSVLLNREFAVLLLIASLLASAAGYWGLEALLDSIWTYHAGVSITAFVWAALAMVVIAVLTVGRHVYRAATANPIEALRYE